MSNLTKASRRLSYLLRHAPVDEFPLSRSGWAGVADVCKELKITAEELQSIVDSDEKGRYKLVKPPYSEAVIKAVQGHSTPQVSLEFPQETPPDMLFHGTPVRNLDSILESGLNAGSRHYIHLSAETITAEAVGLRGSDKAAILRVDTKQMVADGISFYLAENKVWLVEVDIDPKYLAVYDYRSK